MHIRALASAIGLASALLAAAPAWAAPDACALLSAAQVGSITKVKVGAVNPDTPTSSQLGKCRYLHADKASFGVAIIASVAIIRPDRIASQKSMATTLMKLTPVPGVGDFAYYNEAAGVLLAGRGDKAVQVQLLDGPAGAGRLAAISALARAALAKL